MNNLNWERGGGIEEEENGTGINGEGGCAERGGRPIKEKKHKNR